MTALVISDIHANLDALKAVLRDAVGCYEEVWFLGDAVGYGPEPRETIGALRAMNPVAVAGNHDRAAVGLARLDKFNPMARKALDIHIPLLSEQEQTWLAGLPEVIERQSITLCHGSLSDPIWGYILDPLEAAATLERAGTSVVLSGHTHFPLLWKRGPGGRIDEVAVPFGETVSLRDGIGVANPGSLGQPRDGDTRAPYALVDTDRRSITFRRARYNVRRVVNKLRRKGYPKDLIRRYVEGR